MAATTFPQLIFDYLKKGEELFRKGEGLKVRVTYTPGQPEKGIEGRIMSVEEFGYFGDSSVKVHGILVEDESSGIQGYGGGNSVDFIRKIEVCLNGDYHTLYEKK